MLKTFKDLCNRWTEFNHEDTALILLNCGYSEEVAFKSRCVHWNLAYSDLESESDSKFKQQGEDCIWTYLFMNETVVAANVTNCDCSDPDNNDYFDEGRFKSFMIYSL